MKQKLSEQEAQVKIKKFFNMKKRKAKIDSEFNAAKKSFYDMMNGFVDDYGDSNSYWFTDESDSFWKLTRSTPVKVEFDVDALQKKLGKKLFSQVVSTTATIDDLSGLIAYLKQFGVDPKVFKSFITVHKDVDKAALDQLEALGQIDKEDLVGTFEAKVGKPSFRVTMHEKEKDDGSK
jgi:hypothetical protein